MIISAIGIRKPRVERYCERCGKLIVGTTIRLYGCAMEGDPKYTVYLHSGCAVSQISNEKIKRALLSLAPTMEVA